jgi:hypothetical protein
MKSRIFPTGFIISLTLLASGLPAQASFQKLPDGDYITEKSGPGSSESIHRIIFRKRGNQLIGNDSLSGTDRQWCFHGFAKGDRITQRKTAYEPKYSRNNVEGPPSFSPNSEDLELNQFPSLRKLDRRSHEFKVLVSCLETHATWQKNQRAKK